MTGCMVFRFGGDAMHEETFIVVRSALLMPLEELVPLLSDG
jgi:hypothetical protein